MPSSRCPLVLPVLFTSLACGGGGNGNAPGGNSVGADRIGDFKKVIDHARTLPEGQHYALDLPPDMRINNLLSVHVGKEKVFALEFPSHPIDSNPIYIFVDESVPNPDAVVAEFCQAHTAWHQLKKLVEPGWYFAFGV